uniref:Putative LOC100777117 [Glycine max] n=1 Tax=Lepeophtheirus salmonis TaxID=72036 RepID=A0A0K2UKP2_LEPSM
MISSCWINAMLIGYDFPKLCSYLVPALACLHVNYLSHFYLILTTSSNSLAS